MHNILERRVVRVWVIGGGGNGGGEERGGGGGGEKGMKTHMCLSNPGYHHKDERADKSVAWNRK